MHLFIQQIFISAYYVPGITESPEYHGEKTDKEGPCSLGAYFLWMGQKMNCICKPVNNQILLSTVQVIGQLATLD